MTFQLNLIFFLIVILNLSCKKNLTSEQDLYKWINNPENGLIKSKENNGISLSIKYLPPQLLAYQEYKNTQVPPSVKDSIYNLYKNNRTFIMTFEFKGAKTGNNVLFYETSSIEEYKDRINKMSFEMHEFISLSTDKVKELIPVLYNMENIYTLGNKRNITLVFSETDENQGLFDSKEIKITFKDWIFDTGINHFTFRTSDLDNTPQLSFTEL